MAWLDRTANAFAAVGGLAAIVLVGVTFVTVVWRYGIGHPIYGIDDIAKMTLVVCVACSLAYGARRGAHVQVDILDRLGGRRITRYTDVVARLLGFATVGFTAWSLAKKGACGQACGNMTQDLSIPHLPFYMLLAIGFALYALGLLMELRAGLGAWNADRDPNEWG
jgi:TRAP-type C4-dicarboxylate transport system permease small subunit